MKKLIERRYNDEEEELEEEEEQEEELEEEEKVLKEVVEEKTKKKMKAGDIEPIFTQIGWRVCASDGEILEFPLEQTALAKAFAKIFKAISETQ